MPFFTWLLFSKLVLRLLLPVSDTLYSENTNYFIMCIVSLSCVFIPSLIHPSHFVSAPSLFQALFRCWGYSSKQNNVSAVRGLPSGEGRNTLNKWSVVLCEVISFMKKAIPVVPFLQSTISYCFPQLSKNGFLNVSLFKYLKLCSLRQITLY